MMHSPLNVKFTTFVCSRLVYSEMWRGRCVPTFQRLLWCWNTERKFLQNIGPPDRQCGFRSQTYLHRCSR